MILLPNSIKSFRIPIIMEVKIQTIKLMSKMEVVIRYGIQLNIQHIEQHQQRGAMKHRTCHHMKIPIAMRIHIVKQLEAHRDQQHDKRHGKQLDQLPDQLLGQHHVPQPHEVLIVGQQWERSTIRSRTKIPIPT